MKKLFLLMAIGLLIPTLVFGGRISGTIKEGGRNIGPNKRIEIRNSTGVVAFDTTDAYGSYSVYVKEKGKFKLTLQYSKTITTEPIEIYSFENSAARYDFTLYQVKNKTYRLKRK